MPSKPAFRFKRLLLTGAAGGLGRELRRRLKPYCIALRLSDIDPLGEAGAGEECVQTDLADKAAVHAMLEGVDAVVHLGGVSTEQPWEPILSANIVGAYNLYEGARKHGIKRVFFASSNHVTGFYRQDQVIDADTPPRPDGLYGLSKAFGEDLARLYFDRYGIETVVARIGSSFPEPKNRRMLSTWMSYDDLEHLVVASLTAPVVGWSVVYGISDNSSAFYDNRKARHLGFRPRDNSDVYRHALEEAEPQVDLDDPASLYQGGAFVRTGPFE
ncbi:NAD-dependent epimerase/dehydratase family protein [Ramlibacter rhizophilus]|uniref:NAD(P)-dependent oxidoreductase n=1 Tax=Ramlibacter rhizophilus TaxID=1781167 RepID=A0A4Z0C221_9BURK|nr:NAD(P)-dependent oxidoreductase [Ramlibacter rhizophilus]TFZ04530.1 NAD(P)-dependent oxidoreductase [Ramlibacter rhizophilus]